MKGSVSITLFAITVLVCGCNSVKKDVALNSGFESDAILLESKTTMKIKPGTKVASARTQDGQTIYKMNNATTGFKCSCQCGAPSVCISSLDPSTQTITCSGDCSGVDKDGFPCSGCRWRTVKVPSNLAFTTNQVIGGP